MLVAKLVSSTQPPQPGVYNPERITYSFALQPPLVMGLGLPSASSGCWRGE